MLAQQLGPRHYLSTSSSSYIHHQQHNPTTPHQQLKTPTHWSSQSAAPQLPYNTSVLTSGDSFLFGDHPLFDVQPQQYPRTRPLMNSEQSNSSWLSNGQLTPTSATRAHHRESSLSSRGSAGPASPYTANTSNPQVAGEYHEFHDYPAHPSSKPLTPAHTPSQEHFLLPHYSNIYQNSSISFGMSQDEVTKGHAELMPAPDFNLSGRPSFPSLPSHDSPNTPPTYEEERQRNGYRNAPEMPKLNRTMTDIYQDELYNPSFQITSLPPDSAVAPTGPIASQVDVFTQRLQAANSQHLNANKQMPLNIPARERSPFRQGSPLAPSANSFASQSSNVRFGTATHMREQQKAENDARALQQQLARTSPEQAAPKTISPKDVDLIYQEDEEDANAPLFPPRQSNCQHTAISQEPSESEDNMSQQSYGSMATSRRESSSTYSAASHSTQHQNNFTFTPPAVPGSVRRIPQQYPYVPQSRRQTRNFSNVIEDFPATLISMESSSSEQAAETSEIKRPSTTAADSGTYTCTYHGCTLRFATPAKLQRHKREGHRISTSAIDGHEHDGEENGMTSTALRNSQAGPHKCERINPSTGKPCNTVFSRPYDLTRHEDTIHNARKLKVHCPYCTEEKTFSRNDALTRHLRVVHPNQADAPPRRRRGVS